MKVSLITTVFNEESNIKEFLDSIVAQTKKPDEFLITDGGSTDKTVKIIKSYVKKYRWIKLIVSKRASIGKGRNIAIENAKSEIIACTDAGCVLDKNWLKEITKPFLRNKNIDVVVGIYKPYYTNDFEHFQGLVVVPKQEEIFMVPSRMSSRSISFKKRVWKEVKGYPDLNSGEDTEFNIKLIKSGAKFTFARSAIVYWRMRKNWKEFAKQFYRYGVGDRKSGNIWKMKRNLFIVIMFWFSLSLILSFSFIFPTLSVSLIILFFLYFLFGGIKLAYISRKINGIYYGFLLMLIKRVAYILGVSVGK